MLKSFGRFGAMLLFAVFTVVFPAAAMQLGPGKTGFWIGTDNTEVLDGQVLAVLGQHAGLVVLNAPLENRIPEYGYAELVSRLKRVAPSVPVIAYVTPTSWFQSQSQRVAGSILQGLPESRDLLLPDQFGNPVDPDHGKLLFGNVLSPKYHSWVTGRISSTLGKLPVDGIALDYLLRTPTVRHAALCKATPGFCPRHAQGVDGLLASIRAGNPQKILLFNGLFGLFEGQLEDQLKLMPHVDATAIEYFGMYNEQGNAKPLPFRTGILPYLEIASRYPGKAIMFFGRSHHKYSDYEEDYLWQRYLYASYLLGSGSHTLFKYLALFSVPIIAGRAGGLDVYADGTLKLGSPEGRYEVANGIYTRRFSGGRVLVAPHDGEGGQYQLQGTFYSPEGERLSGMLRLNPGQGLILLRENPGPRRPWSADLAMIQKGWVAGNGSTLGADPADNRQFLKFTKPAAGEEWRRDILLDPVRALNSGSILRIRIRGNDPEARILLVAETDDVKQVHRMAVLELSATKQPAFRPAPRIPYRVARGVGDAPYFNIGSLQTDGAWQDIVVDGSKILDAPRPYRFRRWSHLRIAGEVDLGGIEIAAGRQ